MAVSHLKMDDLSFLLFKSLDDASEKQKPSCYYFDGKVAVENPFDRLAASFIYIHISMCIGQNALNDNTNDNWQQQQQQYVQIDTESLNVRDVNRKWQQKMSAERLAEIIGRGESRESALETDKTTTENKTLELKINYCTGTWPPRKCYFVTFCIVKCVQKIRVAHYFAASSNQRRKTDRNEG